MKKLWRIPICILCLALITWAANTKLRSVAISSSTIITSTLDSSPIGATTPSTGVFTVLSDSGLTSGSCLQIGGGGLFSSPGSNPCLTKSVSVFCTPLVMGGNVSGSASLVSVGSVSCTMPSTGCPCRAFINWNVEVQMATNHDVSFWVTDGTNNFRFVHVNGQTTDSTGASQGLTTSATYANSAAVTFTLDTMGGTSANYTVVAADPVGSGANSGMDVSILTSN